LAKSKRQGVNEIDDLLNLIWAALGHSTLISSTFSSEWEE